MDGMRASTRRIRRCLPAAICATCVIAALGTLSAPALAVRGHSFATFGEPCGETCGNGQLQEPAGVAVRVTTGQVYVVDRGADRVERFSSLGAFVSQFNGSKSPATSFASPEGIGIDNSARPLAEDPSEGDVYVVDTGHDVVDKFNAEGKYLSQLTGTSEGAFGALDGVAVDPNGTVWVYQASGEIDSFSNAPSNAFLSSRSSAFSGTAPGFAVDSEDDLYVARTAEPPVEAVLAKLGVTGESLIETIDDERTTGAAVEPASDDVYVDNATTIAVFARNGEPVERFGAGQLGSGSGVAVYPADGAVYVADTATDTVDAFVPEAPSRPTVESVYARDVSADAADLRALIDPHGAQTTYYFRYGTAACAESPSSCVNVPIPPGTDIGSSFDEQPASVHLQQLAPGTTYHYRVVAVNSFGATEASSPTATFTTTTPEAGAFSLPDDRAWEMVSPAAKHGGVIQPLWGEGAVQASAAGGAFSYLSDQSLFGEAQGEANLAQVLATRDPAGGWSSQDITTPNDAPTSEKVGTGEEYQAFSSDLSLALVEPVGAFTPLSPAASERTPYLRDDEASTCEPQSTTGTCYTPLVSAANVPPGTAFGGDPEEPEGARVHVLDATPDLTHVILGTEGVALTATPAETGGLYEWGAGHLELVSALPGAEGAAASTPSLGFQSQEVRGAISDDGSKVFWEASVEGGHHLYVRDTSKEETLQLDTVQGGTGAGTPEPRFQMASADGSRVFFEDEQQLTSGAGEGTASDLYECEIVEVGGKLTCRLGDLAIDHNPEENAEVQGVVLGLGGSPGAFHLYFIARGVLASNENEANGERASAGSENLYVLHSSKGGEGPERWTTSFIATLSPEDETCRDTGDGGDACPARVSPNGRYLAFMSERSITGYDNTDASSELPDEEVFLYDSETAAAPLRCVSCEPTGARPTGTYDAGSFETLTLVDHSQRWSGHTLAAVLPGWEKRTASDALYQPRYLSDNGRLFFDSPDPLVSQDVNGQWDVYEYEPPRASSGDSCSEASETFNRGTGGCVSLVSSGVASGESAFLDASEEGGDVFFITDGKLSAQDTDEQLDVYDAHECTAASPCAPPPATGGQAASCASAEECRPGATQAGSFGASPSGTFSGPGNVTSVHIPPATKPLTRAQKLARALKSCTSRYKHSKRRRAACEKQARKRYGAKAKKKAKRSGIAARKGAEHARNQ